MRRRKLTFRTATAALALSGGLVAGVAYAAIPGGDGTISGCYATSNATLLQPPHAKGDIRVVDAGESCRSYEKPLTWSQRGPQGVPGTPGAAGATGATGEKGDPGAPGTDAPKTNAFVASFDEHRQYFDGDGQYQFIQAQNLLDGDYAFTATVMFSHPTSAFTIRCKLSSDIDDNLNEQVTDVPAGVPVRITMFGLGSDSGHIDLRCKSTQDGILMENPSILSTGVGQAWESSLG